jgi:hypothetical protein
MAPSQGADAGSIPVSSTNMSRGGAAVARQAHNLEVAGAIPAPATKLIMKGSKAMGMEKAIRHHKTHRHDYYDNAKRIDTSCRNHGTDPWSADDRLIPQIKREPAFDPADPIEVDYRQKPKESVPKESSGSYGTPHYFDNPKLEALQKKAKGK